MYRERKRLEDMGNASYRALKWGTCAIYGQFAQQVGHTEDGPPKSHQLEWAGYITSWCRAQVYELATAIGYDNLVSIDTDGIATTAPLPSWIDQDPDRMGAWSVDKFPAILQWQCGVYWLGCCYPGEWCDKCRKNAGFMPPKSRGLPRGKLPIVYAAKALERMRDASFKAGDIIQAGTIHVPRSDRFIGYREFNGFDWVNKEWCHWISADDNAADFVFGGRFHLPSKCSGCGGQGVRKPWHEITTPNLNYIVNPISAPVNLVWLGDPAEFTTPEGAVMMDNNLILYHDEDLGPWEGWS
jgi:hypothetical protein